MDANLILPIVSSSETLRLGGMESLLLGNTNFEVKIPPGTRYGQHLRMKGAARHIDSNMAGGDVHLLVTSEHREVFQTKKDVYFEMPLVYEDLRRRSVQAMRIGEKLFDFKIPSVIQPRQRLRLPRLAEHLNGGYDGDIFLLFRENPGVRKFLGFLSGFRRPDKLTISMGFDIPYFLKFEAKGEWVANSTNAQILIKQAELI
jgi:DnaJ C terminal domain